MSPVRRTTWALGLILVVCSFAVPARAAIDLALANAGSQVPFSQLSDAIPTAWSLLNPTAVTGPAVGQPPSAWLALPANLAEPSEGNPNPVTLGQIVSVGSPDGADRNVWGIFDRLAIIPIPVLLYFDNFSRFLAEPKPLDTRSDYLPTYWGHAGGIVGESSGASSPSYRLSNITEVPEPATALILLPAALALLARRCKYD